MLPPSGPTGFLEADFWAGLAGALHTNGRIVVAVGTTIADRPPQRSVKRVYAYGSYHPIAPVRVDYDGLERSATSNKRDGLKIGSTAAQPCEAMHRPRPYDDASGVEAQP